MGSSTTAGETLRSPIDGTELVRLATPGANWKAPLSSITPLLLTASRTYYVRADGNDSNSGLVDSAGGAFLTIQKAANTLSTLNFGGQSVTIQARTGTFAGATITPWLGGGTLGIYGDVVTPSNVVISDVTNALNFTGNMPGNIFLGGLKTVSTGGGGSAANILITGAGFYEVTDLMEYGASANGSHIKIVLPGTQFQIDTDYTISGGAGRYHVENSGTFFNFGTTVTLTGTPAWGLAFARAAQGGYTGFGGNTFSGAATGKRFDANGGQVDSGGSGLTYFPGNAAGTMSNGGVYT